MVGESFKDARRAWDTIRGDMDRWLHGGGDAPTASELASRAQARDASPPATIREVMTPHPITIAPDVLLHEALSLLLRRGLSAFPVVDRDGAIVGLLNKRHLLMALGDPEATTVAEVMDAEPPAVGLGDSIVEVADHLMTINVRQVLVLDDDGRFVGIVTRLDLMPAILKVFRDRARSLALVIH